MTGRQIDRTLLHQRWMHSHEEDTVEGRVYRPASHRLPPSRGRAGFDLKSDHTMVYLSIGRGDAPEATSGTWDIEEGNPPQLRIRLDSGEKLNLRLIAVEKERLVARAEEIGRTAR